MRDTMPEIDAAFLRLFSERSASERLKMTCDMFDAAKALIAAGIEASHPGISAADLRIRMFDRLYFGDFDAETRSRIVAALTTGGERDRATE